MAFDDSHAARIREALERTNNVGEKKMFGGVGFLLDGDTVNMVSGDQPASLPSGRQRCVVVVATDAGHA